MENQPPFQQPQFSSNPQMALPNATASLVLGIVSIVGCFCYGIVGLVCGIIAIVLSGKDKKLYMENPGAYTPGSYSTSRSGRICAIIGLSLSAIYVIVVIVYLIIFGAAILSNPQEIFNHMSR